MNPKLVTIFTVTGLVAAGTTAFAMSSQTSMQNQRHSVEISPETATSKIKQNSDLLNSNPATDQPSDLVNPDTNPAIDQNDEGNPSQVLPEKIFRTPVQKQKSPDLNDSQSDDLVTPLPSAPPSFEPEQEDDGEDDAFENDHSDEEHEDDGHENEWEDEDD